MTRASFGLDPLRGLALAAVLAAGSGLSGALAQEQPAESREPASPSEPPGEPDIVVRGKSFKELRFEVKIAEEALYARFNDINSDDRFDIHCFTERGYGTRILQRLCLSNSWREQDANIGEEAARAP